MMELIALIDLTWTWIAGLFAGFILFTLLAEAFDAGENRFCVAMTVLFTALAWICGSPFLLGWRSLLWLYAWGRTPVRHHYHR